MDDEIKQNLIKYEAIKQKVLAAFDGVTLGDGIGFWEADARDGYLLPTMEEYQNEKAKDERFDFRKVFDVVEKFRDHSFYAGTSFMDAKGLHFYMPILLLLGGQERRETVLRDLVEQKEPEYIELMLLLTSAQKTVIIETVKYDVDYDAWIEYYINFKGYECHKCGKINEPESYNLEQAKAKVESGDEYILLQYLKNNFKL